MKANQPILFCSEREGGPDSQIKLAVPSDHSWGNLLAPIFIEFGCLYPVCINF